MHELAFGITSNNGAFGPVRNPYDLSKIPGGSSGGNAAGVAARFAPAGVGADAGGREPRCDSGCVAAAAAARDLGQVVRIAHRPERAIVAGDAERQLVHVGLAVERSEERRGGYWRLCSER